MEPVLVHWPHPPIPQLCYLCPVLSVYMTCLVLWDWSLWFLIGSHGVKHQKNFMWFKEGNSEIKGGKSIVWKTILFYFYHFVQFEPAFLFLFVCVYLYLYVLSGCNLATDWFIDKAPEEMKRPYANERVKCKWKMAFNAVSGSVLGVRWCYKK